VESQNITEYHRIVGVGRDLCGSSSPTPCRSRVTYSRLHRTLKPLLQLLLLQRPCFNICFRTKWKLRSRFSLTVRWYLLQKRGLNIPATLHSVWLRLGLCFNMLKFQHMFGWMRALVYRWQV